MPYKMASFNESDEIPMLPISDSSRTFPSTTRSVSLSNPSSSIEGFDHFHIASGYTGALRTRRLHSSVQMQMTAPLMEPSGSTSGVSSQPERYPSFDSLERKPPSSEDESELKHAHLMKSGQLGMCNEPYCTTYPSYDNRNAAQSHTSRVSALFYYTFHGALYDDARGWARRFASSVTRYFTGIINSHAQKLQTTKFFAALCLLAIFIDPLFFFLIKVHEYNKCIVIDWRMTKTFIAVRSLTDAIFFLNILFQFRLAYVALQSRVVGAGELVDQPRKVVVHYVKGKYLVDLFIVLPIPQILIAWVIPRSLGASGANNAKNLLSTAVLLQYIPKLCRLVPMLAGQTPTGFMFESAWANFVINLLTFMLAGHVVGSCWYLFGLQRVNECLRDACGSYGRCRFLIDCGKGNSNTSELLRDTWRDNASAKACLSEDGFPYGIYLKVVILTSDSSFLTRYIYSLFWGFQQISTLAGNLVPTHNLGEVLFTMGIIGLGLLLFALLIGNIQNFLQALGKRRFEMTLRRRDVEQWMSHRRLPEDIRKRVIEVERFNWVATRGVNEDFLFANMPDDLQRDIRRHLFKFLRNVKMFSLLDEPILDAIRERLKQRTYIKDSTVLHRKCTVEKMVFIVRGKMQSMGEDLSVLRLSEGDVCGEELFTWCLDRSAVNPNGTKIKMSSKGLLSKRVVTCMTNVEAFSLNVADLEYVTNLYSKSLNLRVQAATRIQLAWRYRKKRLQRLYTAQSSFNSSR